MCVVTFTIAEMFSTAEKTCTYMCVNLDVLSCKCCGVLANLWTLLINLKDELIRFFFSC